MSSASIHTNPSPHHDAVARALSLCRPLSDPVTVVARWLQISALVPLVIFLVELASAAASPASRAHESAILVVLVAGGFGTFVALLTPAALYILVRAGRGEPVIYLRAFRSDQRAKRLRSLLKAALGPGMRLCGIRPPRERVSWFSRLFLATITGFRYLGSESFELEAADHNWLARLLATCAKARFVFVDVRDVTTHVADEIRLAILNFGAQRCLFIIDETRQAEEWQRLIREMANLDPDDVTEFRLLTYPGDALMDANGRSQRFAEAVRGLMTQIPAGPATPKAEALNFARTRVDVDQWRTPWLETYGAQFLLAIFLGLGAGFIPLLLPSMWRSAATWATLFYAGVVELALLVAYFAAWARSWRQAKLGAALRASSREKNPRVPLLVSILLMALGVAGLVSAVAAVPVFKSVQQKGMATRSLATGKMIALACKMYAMDNNGDYPPTLEALPLDYLPDRRVLVSPFAPNEPLGYVYHPGLTEASDPDAILLEDKYAPAAIKQRVIVHLDTAAEVTRVPER